MKVSILGAGAIGSLLGGLIKAADPHAHVQLLVRGAFGRALADRGHLLLEGPWGSHVAPVSVSEDPVSIVDSDVLFVTVKSHSTEDAIRAAQPYVGEATVVSVQNGINDETLAHYVSPHQLVMGMTSVNVAVLSPGHVSLQLDGAVVLGPNATGTNRSAVAEAEAVLSPTPLRVVKHPNILGVQYNKLAINSVGYASCLSQSNFISECLCDAAWRRGVGLPLLEECIRIFSVSGVPLARIPGRPGIDQLRKLFQLMEVPLLGNVINRAARWSYDRQPIVFSLYQDLLRGKHTEVDFVNGQIVRMAAAQGEDAPYNRCVVELVHKLEGQTANRFLTRAEVIARLQDAAAPAIEVI